MHIHCSLKTKTVNQRSLIVRIASKLAFFFLQAMSMVLQALRNHAVAVAILARVGVETRMKTKRQGLVVLQIKPVGSASR